MDLPRNHTVDGGFQVRFLTRMSRSTAVTVLALALEIGCIPQGKVLRQGRGGRLNPTRKT